MKIEALHDFHDPAFSKGWADRFVPTSERIRLFDLMLHEITSLKGSSLSILELGIGPGYLASYILGKLPDVKYEGLDFSNAMLSLASQRNEEHSGRTNFIQADLTDKKWIEKVQESPQIIVSTWALHDLLSKENIANVYYQVFQLLPKGGVLLNGDFIKPETSTFEYENGRIKPSEHLALLKDAGFLNSECLSLFEEDVLHPTTSNNYACFKAIK